MSFKSSGAARACRSVCGKFAAEAAALGRNACALAAERLGSIKSTLTLDDRLAAYGVGRGAGSIYDALSDLLPVLDCDPQEKLFAVSDPEGGCDLGFVIELDGQTGVDESIRQSLHALVATDMPIGSIVALTAYASPRVEAFVDAWQSARLSAASFAAPDTRAFIERQAEARAYCLKEGAFEQPFPNAAIQVRHFRLFLSVVLKGLSPENDEARQKAVAVREAMTAVLQPAALFLRVWGPAEWLEAAGEMLNPAAVRAGAWVPKQPNLFDELRAQVTSRGTTAHVHRDGIDFAYWGPIAPHDDSSAAAASRATREGCRVRVAGLTAESYAEPISLVTTASLLGEATRGGAQIPCPFALTTILEIPDERAERANAERRLMRCRQMDQTPVGRITGYYYRQGEELEVARASFAEGGVARMTQSLLLFAPEDRADACVHAAAAIGRRAGVLFEPALAMHMQNLFQAIPLCATPALMAEAAMLKRFPRRTVPGAVSAFPVKTESTGTGRRAGTGELLPQLIGIGRKGQTAIFDLFANNAGGFSATVVGKPGSGKSVVLNELALANFAAGGVTRVIDVGRSYEKVCALLKGDFLEFSDAQVWDLNPFNFATVEACLSRLGGEPLSRAGIKAEFSENIERVRDIVRELMTESGLTDLENTILGEAISSVAWRAFEERRVGTLDELYDALLTAKTPTGKTERRAHDIAAMLSPYVKDAPLARWFNGTGRRIDFKNRFIVLELEGLSGMKRLRAAALMSLMLAFRHEMETLPLSQTKLVVIDEAWDLMGSGSSGAFIESGYRRARKHNGSFVTATQSVADYLKSDTARAAWASTDTRIFLRQDDASLKALETLTSDSDPAAAWRKAAIQSLTTVSGAWSEMLIETGAMPGFIVRLFLDRYSLAAYSSHAADRARHEAWLRAGATVAEAVTFAAEGKMPPEPAIAPEDAGDASAFDAASAFD